MKMNPISDSEFRTARIIRWIFLVPAMYGTAFMTGLMFIPSGRPGKVLAILLSALVGIGFAPRHRVWVAVFAFFCGNYIYGRNITYFEYSNFSEFVEGYFQVIVKQAKLFSIPTVLTIIAAILMDRYSRRIESQRAQVRLASCE